MPPLESQLSEGIGCRAGALEGVDEAGTEVELLAQRHQRVGAGRPDDGDSRLLGHLAAGHGQRGTVGPDDRVDLVVLDQPRDRVRRLDLVGLVVHDDELDLLPQDLWDLLVRQLRALQLQLAAEGVLTRQTVEDADLDDVIRGKRRTRKRKNEQQNQRKPAHLPSLLLSSVKSREVHPKSRFLPIPLIILYRSGPAPVPNRNQMETGVPGPKGSPSRYHTISRAVKPMM